VPVTRPAEVDGDIPADQAEPADWYGRARYSLAFDVVAGATGYRVLRASTAALFERDRVLRQTGAAPYTGGPFDDGGASAAWLAENHPAVSVADLTADLKTHPDAAAVLAAWRGWAAWYYPALLNKEVMQLADEVEGTQDAFQPAHPGTIPGPPYRDTLDGRGLGRFVYRVRSVDASGNAGAWSLTFPLVEARDVTPPATPVLLSALGAESAVVITWRTNREPDLAEYRVWSAERAEELADVRRRAVHAQVVPTAGAASESWTDAELAGRVDRFYRVAAVDSSGNVSEPTSIVRCRPVDTIAPNPPAWVGAEWVQLDTAGEVHPWSEAAPPGESWSSAVLLAWEGDEDDLTCMLERRADVDRTWTTLTDWLDPEHPHGTGPGARRFRFVDATADPSVRWLYRVRPRDRAGNTAPGLVERLVDMPEGGG
jgi:hypothetical protein